MSKSERETFLAERCVAVSSVAADGRPPLVMPVLYRYEPDGCMYVTYDRSTEKSSRMAVGTLVTLIVEEHVPWASGYVTVEGVVDTVTQDDQRHELRGLAERYYGSDGVVT